MSKSADKTKAGRPQGAVAREYMTSQTVISRCPQPDCQSTDRSAYQNTVEDQIEGIENGLPYNTVVWRTCQCLKCGQWRRDRSTENRDVATSE